MTELVRGRVVKVRPRADGTFGVTMVAGANGRHFLWRVCEHAPKLGALLECEDATLERYEQRAGVLTVIHIVQGGQLRVIPDSWTRRFVPPQWLKACQEATSTPLLPHQVEGAGWLAERLSRRLGAILADDPGLGKTLTTATALIVAPNTLPAIICCPANVKSTWLAELQQLRVPLEVVVVEGLRGPLPRAHVLICNYDLLRARETQLKRLGARAIVFDEAHILKEPTPHERHRAAVATNLARAIGPTLLLTGTPLPNRPDELWRLLHLADPKTWSSFHQYKERYCLAPDRSDLVLGRQLVTDHGAVYHYDELQARMAPCILRRIKAEVLPHLPPKRRQVLSTELEPIDRRHYDEAEKNVVTWLRQLGSTARAEAATRGQAIVKIQMLRRIAAVGKLRKAVPEMLATWFAQPKPPKLVVFAYHRQVLRGVHTLCDRLGVRAIGFGRSDAAQRQAAVDTFLAGRADVFLAPIRAAGVGINLQSAAHHALFLERLWEPWAMIQAEDRLHRLGQRSPVEIIYLDAHRTVDNHIAAVLAAKQQLIDVVIDERSRKHEHETMDVATMEALFAHFAKP